MPLLARSHLELGARCPAAGRSSALPKVLQTFMVMSLKYSSTASLAACVPAPAARLALRTAPPASHGRNFAIQGNLCCNRRPGSLHTAHARRNRRYLLSCLCASLSCGRLGHIVTSTSSAGGKTIVKDLLEVNGGSPTLKTSCQALHGPKARARTEPAAPAAAPGHRVQEADGLASRSPNRRKT